MKPFLLFILFGVSTLTASAQKMGYADWQYILIQLPELKGVEDQLKTEGEQLEKMFNSKTQALDLKRKAFDANGATMTDAARRNAALEINQMSQDIEKFRQDAATSIQTKQAKLMQPLFAKVGKAIEEVANENNYDFILAPQLASESGGDILLYANEKYNISDLVLKKLGITPKAAPSTPIK
jgi:outer membrane protein